MKLDLALLGFEAPASLEERQITVTVTSTGAITASPTTATSPAAITTTSGAATVTSCNGQYSGGTLAGAVLGTFFGTLLLMFLISSLQNNNRRSEEVIVERKVKSSNGRRSRVRSQSGSSVRRPSRVYSTRS